MKYRLGFLLLIVYHFHVNANLAAASDAPFIYYYSATESMFVIERADGSETQKLAEFQPPDQHLILGAGWSPSGKWFAWTSGTPFGSNAPNMNVYLVSSDGNESFSLLDSFEERAIVKRMAWSSKDDLLLFSYTYFLDGRDLASEHIAVYDPQKQSYTLEFENPVAGAWFLRVNWTPDSGAIWAFDGNLYYLPLGGNLSDSLYTIASRTDGADLCTDFGSLPYWISEDVVAYLHPQNSELMLHNINTSIQIPIDLPDGVVKHVDWSPNGNYALVYLQPSLEDFSADLWLVSRRGDKQLLAQDVPSPNNCVAPFDQSAWNTNDQAFFISGDSQLTVMSVDPFTLFPVSIPAPGHILDLAPIEWTEDNRLIFIWFDSKNQRSAIYSYTSRTGDIDRLAPLKTSQIVSTSFFALQFSHALAFNDAEKVKIVNLLSGQQIEATFQANSEYGEIGVGQISWHLAANWLFISGKLGTQQQLINVMKSDGTHQRYLTLCGIDSRACFGWLPKTS